MKQQNIDGCLLFNISKQAVNPGKNFGPYGLPKSALLSLCKHSSWEILTLYLNISTKATKSLVNTMAHYQTKVFPLYKVSPLISIIMNISFIT